MVYHRGVGVPVVVPGGAGFSAGAGHPIQPVTLRVGDDLDCGVVVETAFVSHDVSPSFVRCVGVLRVVLWLTPAGFGFESHIPEILLVFVADLLPGHSPRSVPVAIRAFRVPGEGTPHRVPKSHGRVLALFCPLIVGVVSW
jgi:hypothetical protein